MANILGTNYNLIPGINVGNVANKVLSGLGQVENNPNPRVPAASQPKTAVLSANASNGLPLQRANELPGGGTYGGGQADPQAAARAAALSQLQSGLGQLDPQLNVGLSNLQNSYNSTLQDLEGQRGIAERNYNTSKDRNLQNYSSQKSGIQAKTRANASALQRLLGINGAGNSSAAYEAAPYLVGSEGSRDLQGAQQVYSNNMSDLDTSWGDTQKAYQSQRTKTEQDRYAKENALRQGYAQTRADILSKIASLGSNPNQYAGEIQGLLGRATQLGRQYATDVAPAGPVNYAAPNLDQYNLDQGGVQQVPQSGAESDLSPTFLNLLAGQKRDAFGNPIYG